MANTTYPAHTNISATHFSPSGRNTTLSLNQKPKNVINSCSVIQNTSSIAPISSSMTHHRCPNQHESSQHSSKIPPEVQIPNSCICGCSSGPLTRSRKRKLNEDESSDNTSDTVIKSETSSKIW